MHIYLPKSEFPYHLALETNAATIQPALQEWDLESPGGVKFVG